MRTEESRRGRLGKHLFAGLLAAMLTGSTGVFAAVIADSVADFSGTQDSNNWEYGHTPGTTDPNSGAPVLGAFTPMGYYSGTYWSPYSGAPGPVVQANSFHPGYGAPYYGEWAVQRWTNTAVANGLVTLSGSMQKTASGPGGDGTTARVFVNNRRVWTKDMPFSSSSPLYNYSVTVPVKAGDVIDMAVSMRTNPAYDSTAFNLQVDNQPATRQIMAYSYADFAGTQGSADTSGLGKWYYGNYSAAAQPLTFTTADWSYASGRWTNGQANESLGNWSGHPGSLLNAASQPVRRWVSGVTGSIYLDGLFQRNGEGGDGDGIVGTIYKNGTSAWTYTIAGNDVTTIPFNFTLDVAANDTIDFVVDPRSTLSWDGFNFFAAMSIVPEPSAVALLGLGGLLLGARRRRTP